MSTPGFDEVIAAFGKRVTATADDVRAGSDYLVVGSPVGQADDPARAAREIVDEIADALRPKRVRR